MLAKHERKERFITLIIIMLLSIPTYYATHLLLDRGDLVEENKISESGFMERFINTKTLSIDFISGNGLRKRILLGKRDGLNYRYSEVEKLKHKEVCVNYTEKFYSKGAVVYSLNSIKRGYCIHE